MTYVDLNSKFRNSTADTNVLTYNLSTIKQALLRLFTTPKGHDPFNREYGSSLYNLLFENVIDPTDIQMFLYMDITTWEPRVSISPADIHITRVDNNTFEVKCNFSVPGLNDVSSTLSTNITKE